MRILVGEATLEGSLALLAAESTGEPIHCRIDGRGRGGLWMSRVVSDGKIPGTETCVTLLGAFWFHCSFPLPRACRTRARRIRPLTRILLRRSGKRICRQAPTARSRQLLSISLAIRRN